MKKFNKILTCFIAGLMALSVTACKPKTNNPSSTPSGNSGKTITLNVIRSRDSGMTDGDRDDAVKSAIEEKFYNDTGIKIDLKIQLQSNTQIKNIVAVNFGTKDIDGIFHYLSEDAGSSITGYAKDANATIDLDPVLGEHGTNILAKINENDNGHLADRAGYFKADGKYARKALTSYAKEGGFGILVRKDYMRSVMSQTNLDPEDYDINNDGFKSMTVSQFEKVMTAIKNTISDIVVPVQGAPWDLQRVVATAYDIYAMSGYALDENGKLVPAQFSPGWDKYVDLMYEWSSSGIWEKNSNNTTDDARQTNFVGGKAAAYMAYPTAEQLITLARKVRRADPSAELMVIAPFAKEDASGNPITDAEGNQIINGNLKSPRAFYGGIVPFNSKNYQTLIKYIDWMYSSQENYELCMYGVKGVDWVDGDDFVYNGKTYKTWRYPDEKADEYLVKPPYTGKYCLLQNINVSNRISGHYSTNEKKWYTSLYFDFPQYGNDEIEGIWQPKASRAHAQKASEIDGEYVEDIRSYAWMGLKNSGKTPTAVLYDYIAQYRANAGDYLDYVNGEFVAAKAYFDEKYGG